MNKNNYKDKRHWDLNIPLVMEWIEHSILSEAVSMQASPYHFGYPRVPSSKTSNTKLFTHLLFCNYMW